MLRRKTERTLEKEKEFQRKRRENKVEYQCHYQIAEITKTIPKIFLEPI